MSGTGWVRGAPPGWGPAEVREPTAEAAPDHRDAALSGTAVVTAPSGRVVPPRGPRRIRVTLSRLDPWTALKVSFVYGLAGLVVFLVAVSLLYGLIDAMGVLTSLRDFLGQINSSHTGPGLVAWLSFGRIFLVTLVVGLVNVVLLSAIATMGAFIYNVSSDVVGGVDLTLIERP